MADQKINKFTGEYYNSFDGGYRYKITVDENNFVRVFMLDEECIINSCRKTYTKEIYSFTMKSMMCAESLLFNTHDNTYILIHNFSIIKFISLDTIVSFYSDNIDNAHAIDASGNVYLLSEDVIISGNNKECNFEYLSRWYETFLERGDYFRNGRNDNTYDELIHKWYNNELFVITSKENNKTYNGIDGYYFGVIPELNSTENSYKRNIYVRFDKQYFENCFDDDEDDDDDDGSVHFYKINGKYEKFTKENYIKIRDEYCAEHGISELQYETISAWKNYYD